MNKKLLALLMFLIIIPIAAYAATRYITLPSSGVVAHVDLELNVSSIDWGVCYIDVTTTRHVTVTNNGTVPHTLTIYTENWSVPTMTTPFLFSTNYNSTVIQPTESQIITLSLQPTPAASTITTFSFDIVFWVEG